MAAQLLAFAVNMGISFLLAPIIEAKMENTYGFVTLANHNPHPQRGRPDGQ